MKILLLFMFSVIAIAEPKHVLVADLGIGKLTNVRANIIGGFDWIHNGKDLLLRANAGDRLLRAAYGLPLWIGDPKLFVAPGIMIQHGHVIPTVGINRLIGRGLGKDGLVYSNHTARHQIVGMEWLWSRQNKDRFNLKCTVDYHFLSRSKRYQSMTIGVFWRIEK